MVMAQIYALVGENEKSLEELELLLSIPSMCTPEFVEADPHFAEIIEMPRYQELANSFRTQARRRSRHDFPAVRFFGRETSG
jgi:hypothetical protein